MIEKKKGIVPLTDKLAKLTPNLVANKGFYLNEPFCLLRLGARLKVATHLNQDARMPFLLHPRDNFTTLFVQHNHAKILSHVGGIKCLQADRPSKVGPMSRYPLGRIVKNLLDMFSDENVDVLNTIIDRRRDRNVRHPLHVSHPWSLLPSLLEKIDAKCAGTAGKFFESCLKLSANKKQTKF
jgi:hypothetical protein